MRGENYEISRYACKHRSSILEQKSGSKTLGDNGLFFGAEKLGATCHITGRRYERLQQEGQVLEPSERSLDLSTGR
jgi:hypothetical protein